MAEACVLYGRGLSTVRQRLVFCMAEACVLFGRGLSTVRQRLVYCTAEACVLYGRDLCTVRQRLVYCMAVRKACFCSISEVRFCMAEAYGGRRFPPLLGRD